MKAEKNRNKQCKKFELNMFLQLVNLGISDKGSDVKAEKNLCEL